MRAAGSSPRELIFLLWLWVRRDIRARYAGSWAGMLWALLSPAFTVLLFYVIFALVLKVRVPELAGEAGFFFYLLAGLLPWLAISEGLSRAAGSLVEQEQFLQKMVFPVEILPATGVLASLLPQLVGTGIFLLLLLAGGAGIWQGLLWFPLLLTLQVLLVLGAGFALSILTVYLRDITQILPVVLQFLFYATPILYPLSMMPERFHNWLYLNPFTALIGLYHSAFLALPFKVMDLVMVVVWVALLGLGGLALFRGLKPTLGDYL